LISRFLEIKYFGCDDTAVAVVDSRRRQLAVRKVTDWEMIQRIGGVVPLTSAINVFFAA
jgi:tRNA A37 threonylcarbamoyltransferase TsaD